MSDQLPTPEVLLEEWVRALESGEYKQTDNTLRRMRPDGTYTYCCLGVACDILVKRGIGKWDDASSSCYVADDNDSARVDLPHSVQVAFGLSGGSGELEKPVEEAGIYASTLIALNDTARYNFKQIAEVIKQGRLLRRTD